ncbi:hypothetical protein EDB89DRAFT_428955 [Lactarius sanguifluus]|nr:hypothetical protein EDB89DRAFT_428955 [Lactarius sanguifluus]
MEEWTDGGNVHRQENRWRGATSWGMSPIWQYCGFGPGLCYPSRYIVAAKGLRTETMSSVNHQQPERLRMEKVYPRPVPRIRVLHGLRSRVPVTRTGFANPFILICVHHARTAHTCYRKCALYLGLGQIGKGMRKVCLGLIHHEIIKLDQKKNFPREVNQRLAKRSEYDRGVLAACPDPSSSRHGTLDRLTTGTHAPDIAHVVKYYWSNFTRLPTPLPNSVQSMVVSYSSQSRATSCLGPRS